MQTLQQRLNGRLTHRLPYSEVSESGIFIDRCNDHDGLHVRLIEVCEGYALVRSRSYVYYRVNHNELVEL